MVLLPPAFELKSNKVKLIKPGMRKLQNMETAAVHRGFTSFQMVHTHTHTGVVCSSLAVSVVPKYPQLLSWACE